MVLSSTILILILIGRSSLTPGGHSELTLLWHPRWSMKLSSKWSKPASLLSY